jgi:sugar phosphate isomerase/epimerase
VHPNEDSHDGISYELFLQHTNNHARACLLYDPSHFVLQCLDYLEYIDHYHERIRMFHVKDLEFTQPASKAFTAVIRTGSTGPAVFAHWAMAR